MAKRRSHYQTVVYRASAIVAALLLTAGCLGAADDTPDDPPLSGSNTSDDDVDDAAPPEEDPAPDEPETGDEEDPPDARPPRAEPAPIDYGPWPSLEEATVRPGVRVVDGGCTSNFLFRTPDNRTLYLGTAAHCVADGPDQTNTNGCDKENKPFSLGQTVQVDGLSSPGTLAYTSWGAMQQSGEEDSAACDHNDFALIEIPFEERAKVHPAMLHFGGPSDLGTAGVGDKVVTYGNSGMRPGVEELNWHEGYVVDQREGWSLNVATFAPGIPGDSGSGVMSGGGAAVGVLVTVEALPMPGTNGVTSIVAALEYANAHGMDVELVTWELLDAGLLP